jgi:hypothetical protein
MTNMADYRAIKNLEEAAAKAGFKIVPYQHDHTVMALQPLTIGSDTALPIYSRDVQLVAGTADQLFAFLRGWNARTDYLRMIKVTTDAKIERKEQDERNRQLAYIVKHGRVEEDVEVDA